MAGNIKGITIEFRGDTTKLDKALRQVNNETRAIDKELKNVDKALKFNPKSVELWREKQQLLTRKISETKDKLDLLKKQQQAMDDAGVDKQSLEYQKLQREIIEAESKLKSFKAQLVKIGNVNLRALGEQFKQIGDKMTKIGKDLSKKVTAPLAALGTVAVKKFADVDKVMQLTNSTMGNGTEEARLLDSAMKSAAASSTYGMSDAATATLNFARAGLDAKQAASALAPAMALAAGEGGELDTVSAGLVATINGFHGSFEEASKYADIFANACNNSALDVNSLSNAMSIAAPIFSSAGYEVKDAALYMGVMANNGIEAETAANSLKTGLARLVSPAKEGQKAMDALGFSATNLDGTMKPTIQIQKELHEAFGNLSESEQIAAASAIFGKNQMAPWLALINTAPAEVDKLSLALDEEGTAMGMQTAMMSGFGGSIEQLKSGVDVLATSLGQALAPVISKVVSAIQKLVDWFNSLSPKMQTVIATVGVVAAAIGPLLVVFGSLASAVGSIITVVGIVGPLIGGLAVPIGIAIAVIMALVAVGITLYKNWDTIKAKALELANNIKTRFTQIKTSITNAINTVKSFLSNSWNTIKSTASTVWNGIKDAITKPIRTAKDTVKGAVDKIKKFFPIDIGNILKNVQTPHFSLAMGSKSFGKLGTISYPTGLNVKWYAQGGIFNQPTLAGIGEAGPEAVVPLDKLWSKMDKIAEGGGNTYNFYITGDNPKAIADEVKRILIRDVNRERLAWQ